MTKSQISLAVPGVQQLHPYQPGKPIEELERELGITGSVKLASNENPLGPSQIAIQAATAALSEATLYPDASAYRLKQKINEVYGISPVCLTIGNGSNDLLELIGRVFLQPGDEVMFSEYAFIVYPIVTQACCATAKVIPAKDYGHDLDAMAASVTEKTKLVYLANPNNPTGTLFSQVEFERFMAAVSEQTIVVLDEAYTEFLDASAGAPDGLGLVGRYRNLIVTRTFSKVWGLAGLRIGFAAASAEVADLLNRVRQPFNANVAALAAAEAVLDDQEYLQRSVQVNSAGMVQLIQGLDQLGLGYIPSFANFITVDCGQAAMPVYESLLREGVIVRPLGIYNLPNHLRVTIGTEAENKRVLAAFAKAFNR